MPFVYFIYLIIILALYSTTIEIVKKFYNQEIWFLVINNERILESNGFNILFLCCLMGIGHSRKVMKYDKNTTIRRIYATGTTKMHSIVNVLVRH